MYRSSPASRSKSDASPQKTVLFRSKLQPVRSDPVLCGPDQLSFRMKTLHSVPCHSQSGPVRSGPVWSGLVWSGPVRSSLVWAGPVRSGPNNMLFFIKLAQSARSRRLVQSGPVRSGPLRSALVRSGPVRSGPVGSGLVRSSRVRSGPN